MRAAKVTNKMAQITQFRHGKKCIIERRIYENEIGKEIVLVNGTWLEIEHYERDNKYEVRRFMA